MAQLNRLFVLALIAFFVSSRLLTSEENAAGGEEGEGKQAEGGQEQPKQEEAQETPAEDKSAQPLEAEKSVEAEKKADVGPAVEPKPAEKLPHKSKATFFIVVGIIVLGLGAIGAAHFLKNSQVSR